MSNNIEKYQRNNEIAALIASGTTTLEQIGQAYGITRERVRQIAVARGVTQRTSNTSDPVGILRAIRTTRCMSFCAAAKSAGVSDAVLRETIAALGLTVAVRRLFRWRKSAKWRARERRLLHVYRAESARLGRPLTAHEAMRLSPPPQMLYGTNYISRLRAALGEPYEPSRSQRYAQRGDLRGTIIALATSKKGCTVPSVLRRIPTTEKSVQATIGTLRKEGLIYTADLKRGHAGHATYRVVTAPHAAVSLSPRDNDNGDGSPSEQEGA